MNMCKIKDIAKLEIIVIMNDNMEVLRIAYIISNIGVPKKNYIAFHSGSNYDYDVIINELPEEFEKQFTCLCENTEK